MSEVLRIELPEAVPAYEPRQTLVGTVRWSRDRPFTKIQLHLYWYTTGVGDQDSEIVETLEWEHPGTEGERFFEILLPRAPYSLQSENLGIHWKLEVTGTPGRDQAELGIVIAPGARELKLATVDTDDGSLAKFKKWIGVGK